MLISVTEGEDKPLKYPTIFNSADVAIVTETDLAATVEFSWDIAYGNIQAVRPGMRVFRLWSKTGQGMEEYLEFLTARLADRARRLSEATVKSDVLPQLRSGPFGNQDQRLTETDGCVLLHGFGGPYKPQNLDQLHDERLHILQRRCVLGAASKDVQSALRTPRARPCTSGALPIARGWLRRRRLLPGHQGSPASGGHAGQSTVSASAIP